MFDEYRKELKRDVQPFFVFPYMRRYWEVVVEELLVNKFRNFIPKDFIEFNMHPQSLLDAFLDQCTSLHNSARGVFKGNSVGSTSNVLEVE